MPTPLGYVDHRPFAGLGVRLIFGRRPDGAIVRVEDVQSGLACGCICPAPDCGQPLIASKGEKVAHHFRHASGAAGCSSSAETNAHLWAKQVLEQEQAIWLPAVRATYCGHTVETFPKQKFRFDAVRLETRLGEIIPDVVLSKGSRELIVEVHVTHACDAAKIAKLQAAGLSALEVDLSDFRTCEDEAKVRKAILVRAPRRWLANPKLAEAKEVARLQVVKANAAKRKAAEAAAVDLRQQLAEAPALPETAFQAACDLAEGLGLGHLLDGPEPRVSGFAVPTRIWRAVVIAKVILPASAPGSQWWQPTVDPDKAAEEIRDLWAEPLRPATPVEVLRALARQPSPVVHPVEAVKAFIDLLIRDGLLAYDNGKISMPVHYRQTLREGGKALEGRQKRTREIREAVDAILNFSDPDELEGFVRENWMSTPLDGFYKSPEELIFDGGDEFDRFEGLLGKLQPSPWRRTVPTETVGLPVDRHVLREAQRAQMVEEAAEAARKAKAEEARLVRIDNISDYATEVLGRPGAEWLAASPPGVHTTWLDAAGDSEEGYERVRRAINKAAHDRRIAQEAFQAMTRRQDALRRKAAAVYDEAHAAFFLNTARNELGRLTPLVACSSDRGLADAISLLPKTKQR